jgi:hypothetical protein
MTEIKEIKDLVDKSVKIFYNDLANNVTVESGVLQSYDEDFLVVKIDKNSRLKWVSKNKIIRVEQNG